MFRYGTLNAVSQPSPSDSGALAVSITPHAGGGLMVVAGRLQRSDVDMADLSDLGGNFYADSQRVSFARWADALEYFKATPYEDLIAEIAQRVSAYPDVKYPE